MSDPERHIVATALKLLARRELSVAQLRERLQKRGFPAELVDLAITRLRADGTLDDRRVAAALARTALLVKHRGPHRVRRQLEAAGIDRRCAHEAVRDVSEAADPRVLLERAVERRLKRLRGQLLDHDAYRRLSAQLIRQGFSSADVAAALRPHRAAGTREIDSVDE